MCGSLQKKRKERKLKEEIRKNLMKQLERMMDELQGNCLTDPSECLREYEDQLKSEK